MQYYTCAEVYADKARKSKSAKMHLRQNKHYGLCLFSLLISKEWIIKAVNQKDSFKDAA